MKFFDLPAQLVRVLSDLRDHGLIQIIGDDPVNVAVYGNYLEQSHFERHFLELDNDAMPKPFVVPIDRIEMAIAIFCAQTDHAVGFQCGVKGQSQTVNQLQVLPGTIPTIKKHSLGLYLFVANRSQQQLLKMVVLCLPIRFFGLYAEINRIIVAVFTTGMNQVHDCDAARQTTFSATVLQLYHLD